MTLSLVGVSGGFGQERLPGVSGLPECQEAPVGFCAVSEVSDFCECAGYADLGDRIDDAAYDEWDTTVGENGLEVDDADLNLMKSDVRTAAKDRRNRDEVVLAGRAEDL